MFVRGHFSAPFAVTTQSADAMLQAFAPDADHLMPFHLVTEGSLWVAVSDLETVQLEQGDIIVLPHGAGHALRDSPGDQSIHVSGIQHLVDGNPPTLRYGGDGDEARVLCGFFHCRGQLFNPLMDALPQVIVIRNDPERSPWLVATLQRTFAEVMAGRPGGAALIERMTGLLFLEVVHRHLEEAAPGGWFDGLTDEVVGKTLATIHAEPAESWTVDELASRAAVSRSVLAERFSELVGMSPIRYLAAWRMELAAQRLLRSDDGIGEIASDVGYESEAAFNRAFKRHTGEPPAAWRRARAGHS